MIEHNRETVGPVEQVLIAARAKIAQGWCKGTSARDVDGWPVAPRSDEACAWCIVGAVRAVLRITVSPCGHVFRLLAASARTDLADLAFWNDKRSRTKKQVFAVYDDAIKSAHEQHL